MNLKNIPSGNYEYIGSSYVSVANGGACSCDNCGRLITDKVTVKHQGGKSFVIGRDCAKTLFSDAKNKEIEKAIKKEKAFQNKVEAQKRRREASEDIMARTKAAELA